MGFGVWGLGFGVWGLGFGVQGLRFRVQGLGLEGFVEAQPPYLGPAGFRVWGVGILGLGALGEG